MRLPAVTLVAILLVSQTACGSNELSGNAPSAVPAAVSCSDAHTLTQRAADDRLESARLSSDRARIIIGNRANFYAQLAIIADLKCRVNAPEADEALKPAFDAARAAEASSSEYERAQKWGEAGYITTQVVATLIQRLPAPAATHR